MVSKSKFLAIVLSGLVVIGVGQVQADQSQPAQPGVQPANRKNVKNNKAQPVGKKSAGIQDQDSKPVGKKNAAVQGQDRPRKADSKNSRCKTCMKPQKPKQPRRVQQ